LCDVIKNNLITRQQLSFLAQGSICTQLLKHYSLY